MGAFSKLMGITFATLLAKPFTTWKAFEYGLIDEKGNILRKPENTFERAALGGIKGLIRKLKRLLIKVIPDSRMLGALIAVYLLRKESEITEEEQKVKEILQKELTEDELNAMISHIKVVVNMNIDLQN